MVVATVQVQPQFTLPDVLQLNDFVDLLVIDHDRENGARLPQPRIAASFTECHQTFQTTALSASNR